MYYVTISFANAKKKGKKMTDFQHLFSNAIKAQMGRLSISKVDLSEKLGWGKNTSRLSARLNNKTNWNTADFEVVSKALDLPDAWALINLAQQEAALAA
jgi:hypothetical protein